VLTPRESILSLVHNKVLRLASNTSAVSGISGFSDDFEDDANEDGVMTGGEKGKENREYGTISCNVYGKYLSSGGIFYFLAFLSFSFGLQSLKVYLDYIMRDLVGSGSSVNIEEFFKLFSTLGAVVILLTFVHNISGLLIGAKARKQLHKKMLRNLFKCPIELFEAYPIGRILNRLSCDMFVIDQKLPSCLQRLMLVSLICLSSLAVNCIQCPIFIIFAIPIVVAYWWVQHFYRCSSRELQRLDSISRAPIFSHFSDTLTGLVTIRSFRVQPKFINELCEKIDNNTAASLILQSGCRWLGLTLDVIGAIIVFTSVAIAVVMNSYGSDPSAPASMGLLITYSLQVPVYLAWVVKFVADIENYMNAVERVLEYTKLDQEEDESRYSTTEDKKYNNGRISFENVHLNYFSDSRPVISGLNLYIPASQKVAICGRSGSGKSTLVMGLVRMARRVQGSIFLDGIDIHTRPLKELRKFICVIHQDICLISGSIRSNLDPYSQFSDEDLLSVMEKLEMTETIRRGLDYELLEGCLDVTPTEKKLICIARLLLARPRVVVLDEATSSLDIQTEKRVLHVLLNNLQGSTIITVAHRLENVLVFDRILVLGDGKILEDGEPRALLDKSMGFFSTLFRQESKSLL